MLVVVGGLQTIFGFFGFMQSRDANVAAKRAEQNTDVALETSNRAYVFVSVHPTAVPSVTQLFGIKVAMIARNGGRTPAKRARNLMWVTVTGTSSVGPLPEPDAPTPQSTADLSPGAELSLNAELLGIIPEHEWIGLREGTYSVFVYGRVDYFDAFGKARYTKFKYRFGLKDIEGSVGSMLLTPDGNEST